MIRKWEIYWNPFLTTDFFFNVELSFVLAFSPLALKTVFQRNEEEEEKKSAQEVDTT